MADVARVLAPDPARWIDGDAIELPLRLTLVALLLSPIGGPALRPLLVALPVAALVVPPLLRSPWFWGVLALLAGARVVLDWPLADNHAYLLAYWCLAVALSVAATDAPDALARNARALVGLVFAFAVAWKLISPDFLDGSFLGATLLLDPRFDDLTRWLTGLSPAAIDAQRAVLRAHVDGVPAAAVAGLDLSPRFLWAARGATWWALAIEASVAVAFLWPANRMPALVRDATLLCFTITTYAVATVAGFGWLLLAMGTAQCRPDRSGTRLAYLVVFGLVLLYREVPWLGWLAQHAALPR